MNQEEEHKSPALQPWRVCERKKGRKQTFAMPSLPAQAGAMLERLRVKQKYRELGTASGESDEGGAKTGEGECEIQLPGME